MNKDNKALQADTQKKEARDAKKAANEQAVVDKKKVELQIRGNAEEAARIEASEKLGVQMKMYREQQAKNAAAKAAKQKVENNAADKQFEETYPENRSEQSSSRSGMNPIALTSITGKSKPKPVSGYTEPFNSIKNNNL